MAHGEDPSLSGAIEITDKSPRYALVEHDVVDRFGAFLGLPGVGMWVFLKRAADAGGSSWPSVSDIAKAAGCSRNTALKYLRSLALVRLLDIEPRKVLIPPDSVTLPHPSTTRNLTHRFVLNDPRRLPPPPARDGNYEPEDDGGTSNFEGGGDSKFEGGVLQTLKEGGTSKFEGLHTKNLKNKSTEFACAGARSSHARDLSHDTVALLEAIAQCCFGVPAAQCPPGAYTGMTLAVDDCVRSSITASEIEAMLAAWTFRDLPRPKQVATEVLRMRAATARGETRSRAELLRYVGDPLDRDDAISEGRAPRRRRLPEGVEYASTPDPLDLEDALKRQEKG